jgi:hypothetical protein
MLIVASIAVIVMTMAGRMVVMTVADMVVRMVSFMSEPVAHPAGDLRRSRSQGARTLARIGSVALRHQNSSEPRDTC